MTNEQVAATDIVERARALVTQATPRPWAVGPDAGVRYRTVRTVHAHNRAIALVTQGDNNGASAELIAAAPELITALADEVERLRAEQDALVDAHVRDVIDESE